jgi:hypothetical protein
VVPSARGGRTQQTEPVRAPAHLRDRALAAGVSTFELARLMGTSVAMIDRTYGHFARDSEDSIRARLEAWDRLFWRRSGVRRRGRYCLLSHVWRSPCAIARDGAYRDRTGDLRLQIRIGPCPRVPASPETPAKPPLLPPKRASNYPCRSEYYLPHTCHAWPAGPPAPRASGSPRSEARTKHGGGRAAPRPTLQARTCAWSRKLEITSLSAHAFERWETTLEQALSKAATALQAWNDR